MLQARAPVDHHHSGLHHPLRAPEPAHGQQLYRVQRLPCDLRPFQRPEISLLLPPGLWWCLFPANIFHRFLHLRRPQFRLPVVFKRVLHSGQKDSLEEERDEFRDNHLNSYLIMFIRSFLG